MPRVTPPNDGPSPDTPTIPSVIQAPSMADYLGVIARAVFQAGVSWAQIAKHWNAYRSAFVDFDVATVAAYDDDAIERVLATPGVLRMRRKVVATIANARALLNVEREYGSFDRYVARFAGYTELATDMKRRFSFIGDMSVWYVLFRTGNAVPPFESWVQTIPGEHPRMREMVERAREGLDSVRPPDAEAARGARDRAPRKPRS